MDASATRRPDPEGVSALLEITSGVVADERSRGQALDTKTATLATFTGAILTLNVTLGRPLFQEDLGPVGDPALRVCFLIATLALWIAVVAALAGVLRPQATLSIDREQVRSFARFPALSAGKTQHEGQMLSTLGDVLELERPVNDQKATATKVTAWGLVVGFSAVAGEALTLGLRQIGL